MTADETLVAAEVARLRQLPDGGTIAALQADLLEQASPELGARFLREQAMRALSARTGRAGYDAWVVSADLQWQVFQENRAIAQGEVSGGER